MGCYPTGEPVSARMFHGEVAIGARPGLCGGSRYFNVSAMYDAETDPARNLRLMTFRERIGRAKLALGRS